MARKSSAAEAAAERSAIASVMSAQRGKVVNPLPNAGEFLPFSFHVCLEGGRDGAER